MMQYSRSGIYINRKKKARQRTLAKSKSVDWVNIFLFVLLFVVIILFVVT
jgi:hypothetical protein